MKVKLSLPRLHLPKDKHIFVIVLLLIILAVGAFLYKNQVTSLQQMVSNLTQEKDKNLMELEKIGKEIETIKNEDQFQRNEKLQEEINNIQKTYNKAVGVYEDLLDLKAKTKETAAMDEMFTKALASLSKRDYSAADSTLNDLAKKIDEEDTKIAASFVIPENTPENNTPPASGYSRQSVNVEGLGSYLVSIVSVDLGSTRVIVDTASTNDCANDCPVLPLATYVSRNGAFAGINGTYFCPAEYPTCAGKTNTFDLLVMNKDKYYFNSANNVYSNNPAVIFGSGYIRFVGAASQWGRDTGIDSMLSNYPLLVAGGNVAFGGDDDPKKGSKGGRSFVANKGNTVYIGVVHSATVAESARVLKTMGMENGLNLDNGGSTALWSGGYKVGPGRNLPNVILFVRK